MNLFEVGEVYKFEVVNRGRKTFYTGRVISENNDFVRIKTIHPFNEDVIIKSLTIVHAIKVN